jgi:hypothetical protein
MRQIASTSIISVEDNASGYMLYGYIPSGGESLPTTASTFAVGCEIRDNSTGFAWVNLGTVAIPVWETRQISKTVSLTAAEIFTLYSVGKEIIPAVPGKAIILEEFDFDLTATATQFASGGVVNLQYDSTVHGAGTTLHADITAATLTGATARIITHRIPKDLSAIASTAIIGKAVWIGAKSGDFDTGTGTAVVKVRYHII